MQIKVTKEHIKNGTKLDCNYCPVALAIKEQIEDTSCVEVCDGMSHIISFFKGDDPLEFTAPDKVYEFVEHFDLGEAVKPFKFELPI